MEINKNTALITGGGSGLGAAVAKSLAANGAEIVILDNNTSAAEAIASELNGLAIYCDVSDATSVEQAFQILQHKTLTPRIYVNCAGIAPAQRIVGKSGPMPFENFTKTIDINLNGTFNILRLASNLMSQLDPINQHGERGVIINTASVAAYEGQIGQAAYAASKAGVVGLTLPAARELARFGIRVNTIAPGLFATPILLNMAQEIQDGLINSMPFPKRFGEPSEFAELVNHIVSNPMLNGTTIRLDGAMRMQ
ncbi:MAG: SDR family NAD(P)-dependent oxidoreductase [Gammaproteobacteria bacterium]|nr:SDR family NAD(P)-dependent oxidoreductase [Gammaproteobacteria bacterium]